MAIYRNVQLSFWTDRKVEEDFTPEDKYFYLYLFTNPHTNLCGCYELGIRQAVRETGYNEDTVLRLIDRFENVHGVISYDKKTKEILILNWHKYNWTKSGEFMKGLDKHINNVKSDEFRNYLLDISNGIERVYRRSTDRVQTSCLQTSVTVTDTVNYSFNKNNNVNNFIYTLNNYKDSEYINSNSSLLECLKDWFEYKDSRKPKSSNHYGTEKGIELLLNKVVKNCKQYGVQAVIETINDTIANNYQGIVWDWLQNKRGNVNAKPERRNTRADDVEIDPYRAEVLAFWREQEGMQ